MHSFLPLLAKLLQIVLQVALTQKVVDSANVGADAILLEALARDAGELGRVIAALWDTSLILSRLKKIVIAVASIDELVGPQMRTPGMLASSPSLSSIDTLSNSYRVRPQDGIPCTPLGKNRPRTS